MLTEIELQSVIQLVFKYLNTNLSINEIEKLAKDANLSLPFVSCLGKISENKTIIWEEKRYLWKDLNREVRDKIRQDKISTVLNLAFIYLDTDLTITDLSKLEDVSYSSSSIQRYFNELIPQIPCVVYHEQKYTGVEFGNLLNKKMAEKKQNAPQKGGISSSIKASPLKDSKGRFIGSRKNERIAGKYSNEVYNRALEEAKLFQVNHSSTRLVAKKEGVSKETIRRDFHQVLKESNYPEYEKILPQLEENKNVAIDKDGRYIDAEEKHRRQK